MINNLSDVPPNWIKVRFDEIAENITDRIEKPNESGLEYYIGLEHLDTDQIRIKRFGSTEDVKATKFLCKKGDIIFGKRNAYLRKVAVTDRDAVVSAHSMVIRPIGDLIVPDFLPCFMQSSIFWKTAHAISEGSMSPTIKWKTLAKQEFWIPSIDEQKKIAETSKSIQQNIDDNEKLTSIIKKMNINMLEELITKGYKDVKLKNGENSNVPVSWKHKKIIDFCYVKGRIGWKGLKKKEFTDKGPYLVTGTDFVDGKVDWDKCYHITEDRYYESPEIMVENGDILLTKDGTIGKIAFVEHAPEKVSLNSHLLLIRPNDIIIPKYLYYVLNSNIFRLYIEMQKTGSTLKGLSQKRFEKFEVAIPPINEQKKIVEILELFDELIKTKDVNSNNLNNLKKKLTDDLISGNLKIPPGALRNVQ
jgi:type I restriction enzyme S subunit